MDIFISKTILNHELVNNDALAVYVALRSHFELHRPVKYISDNMLCYELYGNSSYTKYTKQAVKRGLEILERLNLIKVKETISKSEYVLDMTNLFIEDGEYYVMITDEEVRTIFASEKADKFALLRYFACMMGTINYNDHIYSDDFENGSLNNFVGYMTVKYIASLAWIPEKTALNYNSILESLGLIYIYRHEKYNTDGGEIKSLSNHYGRRCYAKYITQFALQYEQAIGEGKKIMEAKKNANAKRSLTQKYNAFINGKDYAMDEVIELYGHVLQHNEKCQKIINGCSDLAAVEKAKKEIKDTSKFEEYFGLEENGGTV